MHNAHRVKLAYRLLLPVRDDSAFFRYVLRSASLWSAPIGRETVTVRPVGSLQLKPPESTILKPARQKDGSWLWTLENTRPKEDVVVTVSLPLPQATKADKGP